MKFVLFIGICVAIAEVCLNARLRVKKSSTDCTSGRVYNMYSNRCEANGNTITQKDKPLDFFDKYKKPTIVQLLPIFKYSESENNDGKKEKKTEKKEEKMETEEEILEKEKKAEKKAEK